MPTYQYACTNAEGKHEFEVVQSFSDAPVAECPECDAPVRKVYGSVGVVFKGSGFYRTDSRTSSSASQGAGSSSDGAAASTPAAAKDKSASSAGGSASSSGGSGSASSSGSGSGSKAAKAAD